MKKLLLVALAALAFAACKKDNSSPHDGVLTGEWRSSAVSESFAQNPVWEPVAANDTNILVLRSNDTYSFTIGSYYSSAGTFTVSDSANSNIKILTLSEAQGANRFFIRKLSATEFKMDYNPGFCGTGYMTRKFTKKD